MHQLERIGRGTWIAIGAMIVVIAIGVIAYVVAGGGNIWLCSLDFWPTTLAKII